MKDNSDQWNPVLYNDKHAFVYEYGKGLIDLLQPQPNERILDLGCGSGQLTDTISEISKNIVGIDNSAEMIADAKIKYKHIDFRVEDATQFNFDHKFDAIFSNATLHWVTNFNAAINSMYHNLRSNGRIVVEFGGKGNVQTIVNQLRISLANRGYTTQSQLKLWYFPSIGEYTTALESANFKVVFAQHFERPTELADNNTGIKDWISMFGKSFFKDVNLKDIEDIKNEIQEKVKPTCLIDGKWYADYKRIRIIAFKQ